MSIFKAYDIRGTYPDQLNEELARRIGLAAARVFGATEGQAIVTGRDARTAAPAMQRALNDGLTAAGANVIDIGRCVTPLSYFACGRLKSQGAVQCTASHNPAGYSGFKLSREGARPVSYDTGISEIEKRVAAAEPAPAAAPGSVEQVDLWPEYKQWLLSFVKDIPRLKIVVDTGNGVAGVRMPELIAALGCDLVGLYLEPDGTFPNHEPDPLKAENMRDLQAAVREHGADLGVAFDGDGDRIMFVDDRAEIVPSDHMTAVLARDFLADSPGAAIAYDLRSSWIVPEEIEKAGGRPVQSRVGHSFIKALMREQDVLFAGELSGHYYFRDAFFTDNAEMALIRVLNHLGRTGHRLSDVVSEFKRYHASGEINFEVADKDAILARIEERFHEAEIEKLDGITVRFADWWFNVRASNTEPVLRLNLEAKTSAGLKSGLEQAKAVIGGRLSEH